jgi:RNA polymerase sigma-70 factor (ECF subfamily)
VARHADAHVSLDPDFHGREEIDAERVLSGMEELDAAAAALLSLPERTRTIFLLRRLEGYSYRDIAGHLGISVSAVEKHLVKAIRHLAVERDKQRDS